MRIIRRRGWEIPESQVTPESVVLNRRALIGGTAALLAAAPGLVHADPNPKYEAGRALTEEKYSTTYNNYYEFSESKNLWKEAQGLKTSPWTIEFAGLVKEPRKIAYEDLLKQVSLEERIYRHRCVEAWAMTVPWTGFPMTDLLKLAEPLGSAKFVAFETVKDKSMSGLRAPLYPWPYVDGLAIDEAANELAFMTTGMYGKPLPPQNGGPIRMTTPWKYGFKQVKSVVKVTFTEKQPRCFWQEINGREYGFWANVNPDVEHPRWSQARERLLGTGEMVPTQIYNGYGDIVASLYSDRKSEKLFM
ncbi:MAG: protein-methionine-sulfoxide reductase catalytic subunit MsrP [Acetobacteraceae bacterium]|nr:protein-methionine-sulfoxide reductase catalytic subunit MsrP [Acetobacteraceae bacterium]